MQIGKIILGGVALIVTTSGLAFKTPKKVSGGNLYTLTGSTCTLKTTCHTGSGTVSCPSATYYTLSSCTGTSWSGATKVVQ